MYDIEKAHYDFQKGIFFTRSRKIKGAELFYNDKIDDSYWNYAAKVSLKSKSLGAFIKTVVDFYSKKKRAPAVYVTPQTEPIDIVEKLTEEGFSLKYNDAWMIYSKNEPNRILMPAGLAIEKVSSKPELKSFIKIFEKVYGLGASGLYSNLSAGYSEVLEESFSKKSKGRTLVHYLAKINGKPVGCASMIFNKKYAALYSLGVIPEFRRKGIAIALAMRRIEDAKKNGIEKIFLQTEEGSENEKLFERWGFRTSFVGRCYVLESR